MSWHTEGEGKRGRGGVLLSVMPSRHSKTGASNMREHRLAKRQEALARNENTLPERRRQFRLTSLTHGISG